jgi:hypothetical protein
MCRDATSRGIVTENTLFPCSVSRNTANIDTAVEYSHAVHNENLFRFTGQRKKAQRNLQGNFISNKSLNYGRRVTSSSL